MTGDDDLARAVGLAAALHHGQKDKAGEPYIAHVVAVIAGVARLEEKIAAALHDTVEDCGIGIAAIANDFGAEIAASVDALTRRPGEAYLSDFIPRCAANPIARAVKISDLRHNMDESRLKTVTADDARRLERYAEALAILTDGDASSAL